MAVKVKEKWKGLIIKQWYVYRAVLMACIDCTYYRVGQKSTQCISVIKFNQRSCVAVFLKSCCIMNHINLYEI